MLSKTKFGSGSNSWSAKFSQEGTENVTWETQVEILNHLYPKKKYKVEPLLSFVFWQRAQGMNFSAKLVTATSDEETEIT